MSLAAWQDLRLGARTLRRSPAFTISAVVVLALGIGVTAGVFSAVDALVLRPLPYGDVDRVAAVSLLDRGTSVSKATLERLRERQRSFESVAGYSPWGYLVRSRDGTSLVQGAVATAELFAVLGARPQLGRTLEPGDDQPGRAPVVVLSHGRWQREHGASRDVLGQSLMLNGVPHTVVGVMHPEFEFPTASAEMWTPARLDPADQFDYASAGYLLLIARLRAGVSVETASADVRSAARSLPAEFPDAYGAAFGAASSVTPLREAVLGSTRLVMLLAFGAVGLVVLITCANVGNLVLARSSSRARDAAVRRALGAGPGHLVRLILNETLLLGLLGGALGTVVAGLTVQGIGQLLPPNLPGASNLGIDGRVLLFTTLLSVVAGAVCGLLPAVRTWRDSDLAGRVKAGSGRIAGDGAAQRAMGVLLVVESATAVLLALGAGLMLQTVWRLSHERTGFVPDNLLAFDVILPPEVTNASRQVAFFDALRVALTSVPGVSAVATGSPLPFSGSNQAPSIAIEGTPDAGGQRPSVDWRRVSPSYFSAMGIPLQRGRVFDSTDTRGTVAVAVINETFARRHFAGSDPIGRRVRTVLDGPDGWATIVGVVGDTRGTSLVDAPPPQMYRPLAQRPASFSSFVVRVATNPGAVIAAIPASVRSVDRHAVWLRPRLMHQMLGESFTQRQTLATILSAFAFFALTLGCCGVAALAAYRVSQRRREIAVRIALGSAPGGIARLIVRESLSLTSVGLAVGFAAALGLTRLLESQLHGVRPADPLTYAGVATAICLTTVLGAWGPARAAARVHPASVLREN